MKDKDKKRNKTLLLEFEATPKRMWLKISR